MWREVASNRGKLEFGEWFISECASRTVPAAVERDSGPGDRVEAVTLSSSKNAC